MDRRGFLQRLGAVAAAAGIATAAPPAVAEAAAQPPLSTATPAQVAAAAEPIVVPEGYIVYSDEVQGYIQKTADGWRPFTFPTVEPKPQRRTLASLSDGEQLEVIRNSLAKMGAIADDAFLPGSDEVVWRWEQVRTTVMNGYATGWNRKGYLQRIIALPAVADAVFVPGEPGYAEWRSIRSVFYRFANKAMEV
jgi:hypothetical protein